ncbi:outer membrane protein [Bartonella jaculi]|uniref:Porin family protein n=1 Tax=Bartonella jaculi TaxID=686226 RepID=A0ABP9MXP1_9HYPH
MTTKYLITTSVFILTSVSAVQAADVVVPEQPAAPVIAAPSFSWSGFYLGGQIGGFSGKTTSSYLKGKDTGNWTPVGKEFLPKLSGFVGGIYAGYNVDVDNGVIIGIDTDIMWSDKKDTKDVKAPGKEKTEEASEKRARMIRAEEPTEEDGAASDQIVHHTLKQKWFGATRVRIGFSTDRIMPYVAGGVAYTQLRNIYEKADNTAGAFDLLHDEKKKMVGYTLGGGLDFAITDNFIVRAEYRYSDYGKKKLANDKIEIGYKTNDFRAGVAYKF